MCDFFVLKKYYVAYLIGTMHSTFTAPDKYYMSNFHF